MEEKKCTCEECKCEEIHECNCEDNCTCSEECGLKDNCICEDECTCDEEDKKQLKKDKKNKKANQKIEELEKRLKESEEKILLAKAELINYRKRKDEEVIKMLKYSSEDMIRELLPIVDNFERAIKLDDNNLEDDLSKFLEGFKMIYCNLVSILEKNDVKQIDGINKPFDPTYHQAVLTEPSDGEKDMILEVLQKGYLYKDKVIRPAMVKVSE